MSNDNQRSSDTKAANQKGRKKRSTNSAGKGKRKGQKREGEGEEEDKVWRGRVIWKIKQIPL